MFFLDHDDLVLIGRRLGPQARREPVAEELRGWAWDRPPLSPVFEPLLEVSEIAGGWCATGRDSYLTRVLGVPLWPAPETRREQALRAAVIRLVTLAKRAIYQDGARAAASVAALSPPPLGELLSAEAPAPAGLAEQVERLWGWETARLAARIGEAAAITGPTTSADTLTALAVPVTAARRLDGRYLGLAAALEADGIGGPVAPVVLVLRFGAVRPAERLLTTGLALALEAAHDAPVDLGCTVTCHFVQGYPVLTRDLHVIDDELRQQFIEARDERARLVQEEIDPGLPATCPEPCPYRAVCLKGG